MILSFFEGDVESSELFIEIAAHMIDAVPGSLIRYNASIVGVAKPGERYRFYVSKKDGVYSIKYKYEQEPRLFVMDKKEEFIIQQDTIELRLEPTTQSEFNFDLQTDDNIIALFKKGNIADITVDNIVNYLSVGKCNNELCYRCSGVEDCGSRGCF